MVIPNSKIVINPGDSSDAWRKELYLRPGDWIPWVGVSVVAATVTLAAVVLVLHLNEKVSRLLNFIIVMFVMPLSHVLERRRIGEKEGLAPHQFRRAVTLLDQEVHLWPRRVMSFTVVSFIGPELYVVFYPFIIIAKISTTVRCRIKEHE